MKKGNSEKGKYENDKYENVSSQKRILKNDESIGTHLEHDNYKK